MGDEHFMDKAIKLAVDNVKKGGGPFGAVIVKDGEVRLWLMAPTG